MKTINKILTPVIGGIGRNNAGVRPNKHLYGGFEKALKMPE